MKYIYYANLLIIYSKYPILTIYYCGLLVQLLKIANR